MREISVTVSSPGETGYLFSNYNYIHSSRALSGQTLDNRLVMSLGLNLYVEDGSSTYQVTIYYPRTNSAIVTTNLTMSDNVSVPFSAAFTYDYSNSLRIRIVERGEEVFDAVW